MISGADEDGRVMVEFSEPVGGRVVKSLTPEEINGMLYKEETSESPANAEEAMSEETEPPTAGQEESGESALERIPKDAQTGEPQYTQTDAPTAWDAIVEQTEGDEDMARSVVDSTVRDKEAALKKLESSNPKPGATVAEKIAAAKEHKAAIEAARQELEQWKAIAEVENSRKAEAEAKAKAEEEEAKAKAKAEEEEKTDESAERYPVGLDEEESSALMERMEAEAAEIPLIELNPANWVKEFGEKGIVSTPIGEVKMGENQIAKLFEKGRSNQFGMIRPTLETPQLIIEVPSFAADGNSERGSSLLFVKTFTDSKGRKIYYFKSVTVKKDGLEVSVSSHYDRPKRIKEALKKGKLLYRFDGGAQTEQRPADVSVATSREVSQGISLAGKVSESPETKQEKAEKSISAKVKEASADVNTEPTEAQKEAGNYKKGHVQVGTFDITIEQPEGSIRRGTDADGKQWESKMHNTYGYFRGTEGVDGDHIDVFLSNDMDGWNGAQVFVVDQYNPDGTFDEHKVMLGFNDASDAKNNYLANYEKGWENGRRIDVSAVNLEDFEKWIASSHRKTKPFSEYKSVKPADDSETFKGHKAENSGKDIEAHIKHLEEIKDYPGADKKIVQSEIDRLKAKEEAKAKSKSEEAKSKSEEKNDVDDAKIDAVLEALSKGDEKAEQLVQGLTSRELSKLRSKVKASPLLENEWQWRAQNRGDVSLHDWMLENQYVEPVKRVSGTFKMTDYIAPKDSPYAERIGGVYHDKSGFAVATDGRILVADKGSYDPKLKGKIIGKDGAAMENKFPDWQEAISTAKETKSSRIDAEDLHRFVAGVLRANKLAYISLRFPDGTVGVFKANRLNLMLRAMKQLGTSELLYTKDGMILVAKSEKGTAMLMGLVSVEDELVEANGYAYPGNTVSYHRGEVVSEMSQEERVLRDAVIDRLRESGMEVITDKAEGQRVLDMADDARLEARRRSEAAERRNAAWHAIDSATAFVTGRTEKEVRRERQERMRGFRAEAKELYGRVLSGNFDDVTLRLINGYIDNSTPYNEYWRPLSKRLPSRVGRGLRKDERANAVDALFSRICESAVGKNGRTGADGRREIEAKKEELLEKWAKATGHWHETIADFTDKTTAIKSGTDSDVYLSKDGNTVIKASKGKFENRKFPSDVDQVALFNSVFPNSRYKILGYGRVNGHFVKFLEQNFVDFSTSVPLTAEERTEYMHKIGFEPRNGENTVFSNGSILVSDLQKSNIVRDRDGNIRVIDADVKLHTRDIGGTYSYPDVETDTETPEAVREHRVYHGSGADFDAFDHSHMGEGEGAQAYGWGTYVTEVEGIGRTYAEQNAQDVSPTEEDFEMMNAAISEKVLERFGGIDTELRVDYDGDGGFNLLDVPNNKEVLVKFRKYFENHPDEFDGYIEDYDLDDEYGRRDFADAVSASMLDFARKVAEDYKDKYLPTKQRILYTVDIPDDNGRNYLDWNGHPAESLLKDVSSFLESNGFERVQDSPARYEKGESTVVLNPNATVADLYAELQEALGSDKKASQALAGLGYIGIKYPADYMRGGREDGKKNYVIFDEKDAKITDHVRFFRTAKGEAYGFTVGGKIYIDPKIANTETPIHEYAHLWAAALRGQNPKEWRNIVELMKGTSVWGEVKKRYPELNTDDDIADEVLATYSGRRGAERLREEQRKIAGDKSGVFEKAEAISALERVKQALRKFWKSVADFLHIHYKSAEEVADRVMKDLLDGVDPRKHFNSRNDDPRFMFAGEKGAARADRGEEALTRQNNLGAAQKMEAAKKEAEAIKLATGWERGADGKWRYEIPDGIYHPKGDAELKKALARQPWREELNGLSDRILDGEGLSKEETERFNELAEKEAAFKADYLKKEKPHLADWLENDELFKAYPELKRVGIVFTDNMPKEQAGYYDSKSNTITVNTNSSEDAASIIAHEVQHAIQRYEGFATGGNLKAAMEYLSGNKRADVKIKQQLAYKLSQEKGLGLSEEEVNSLIGHLEYEDISDDELQKQIDALCQKHNITEDQLEDIYPMDSVWHEAYNRISGEAEARNVQKRMGMTAEERRVSLAADTEDVARADQILLFADTGESMSLESPKEERIEKLRESKPVEITGEEITPSDDLKQYKRNALEYGKKLRDVYTNEDTGEQIELTGGNRRGGLREILQHDYKDKEHLQSIAAIPQIIEKAIFIDELPNEDRKNYPGVRAFRYYVCGLKIADVDYTVKAVIAEQNNGERYYDHKLTKIEKGKLLSIIPTIQKADMDSDLPRSVGKDSRLLSILQVKDEKKPNDGLYRVGGSKELRDGRKIAFVRKPTATYNALARHLQAEGIKPDMHEARTGSRYMSFEKDGVQWEVRSSDHTKPEYYGEAQKPVELTYYKDKQGEENLSVSVDLGTSGYNIEDMKALMAEIDGLKNDAGEVKESFDRGVASDEVVERYPLLSQALGVKSENEVRAKEEARKHAEEARKQEMRSAVEDMAGRLHLSNVDIVDKPAGRGAGRRERAKGMFERSTGRITINIGNCADKRDAVVTLLHEAVAHHGLRKLFGENFETFLDNVYNSANAEIRRIIDKHSSRYGGDKRTATEEYMASLAERTDFENAKKSGWWQRIKDFFLKMLEKIGLKGFKGEDLSDNELRYVLWRSYENLKSGGKDTVFSAADDLAKQSELKVGEFAPEAKAEGSVAALNTRFNNELQQQIDGNLPSNHIYQMGNPGKILLSTGVPDLPIQMNAKRLQDKATLFDHNFELYEVKDLVKALQNPLAVFSYGDKTKAQNIIVPLQKNGKNFIVGLSLNPTVGGKALEINSIRNVFPKDNSEWLNWISQGKALYLDKEKIQTLIAQQRTNLADVEYLDLDSAAKVVENFENPKPESKNDILFRDGDAKDYEKAQARETYERRVSTGMFQSREAIQDSMLSLKVAMDAIEEATAGKAKRIEDYDGFENAYLGENRLSSVNQAESAAFAHLLIRPMMEEVNRLAPTAEDRAELIDYMFAKHGLERNAYMRQQAAEKKLAEYKKQNPGTAKTAADFIDSERDYAGLTTLTGEADVSAAEAEAQRMVADYENDYTFHGTWNEIYVCRKKIC